jgi:hypothetical protein
MGRAKLGWSIALSSGATNDSIEASMRFAILVHRSYPWPAGRPFPGGLHVEESNSSATLLRGK